MSLMFGPTADASYRAVSSQVMFRICSPYRSANFLAAESFTMSTVFWITFPYASAVFIASPSRNSPNLLVPSQLP